MSTPSDRIAGKITDAEALGQDAVILTLYDARNLFERAVSMPEQTRSQLKARIEELEAQVLDLQKRMGLPQLRTWREQQARIDALEAALVEQEPEYAIEWTRLGTVELKRSPQGSLEHARAVLKVWAEVTVQPDLVRGARIVRRVPAGAWAEVD